VALLHTFHGEEKLAAEAKGVMQVNVQAFTGVLCAVLPHMVKRGIKGGIVNVSSGSALHGLAYNTVYAGSKVR